MITIIMQVLLLFALFSLGFPASLSLSLRRGIDENANIVPMKVKGEIGGHYVELEGTIQEVYAQAQKLYPDIQLPTETAAASRRDDISALDSRQAVPAFESFYCTPVPGQNWGAVWQSNADPNINFLNSNSMTCCAPPGPGVCIRTSCSYNTAIWLCNDNESEYCTPCSTIAYYANEISHECAGPQAQTGGQQFSDDGMNVILDDDSSCPAETRRSLERNIDENVIRDNIPEASVSVRGSNDAELEVRTLSWGALFCIPVPGQPWDKGTASVAQSIANDWMHGDTLPCCASARSCSRLACAFFTAIWLCNDNDHQYCVDCYALSSYVDQIINRCGTNGGMTGGQQFSSDNVNVIVNYDGYCPQWPGRSVGRSVNENIASVNAPESDSSSRRSIDENLGSGTIPEAGISARDSVDESVTFDKMGFKGEIGGHYVELEGTVQEIYAQAKELYPDIQLPNVTGLAAVRRDLEDRQVPDFRGRICWPVPGQPWEYTWQDRASHAYLYLYGIGSWPCSVAGGPGKCITTSCTANTAIDLCNDNRYAITMDCSEVAQYAADISSQCLLRGYPPQMGAMTGGQEFSDEGFNIVLRWDNSCP